LRASGTPNRILIFYSVAGLALVAAFRILLEVNLPLIIREDYGHDDALFMNLANYFAQGQWFGPFNEFTLMKGPGYPVFLALGSLSGLPISLFHALFHVGAIAIATLAFLRLTGSKAGAAGLFIFLSLMPADLVDDLQRVLREQIYWGQTLILVSTLGVLFLAPPRHRSRRIALAVFSGFMFGWAWLTREEGVWFLPGLGLMLAGAAWIARGQRARLLQLGASMGVLALTFIALNAIYIGGNALRYGRGVGVDTEERNFKAALSALQSVKVGDRIAYVPVPRAVQEKVALVSPTFQPIAAALAPGGAAYYWSAFGCQVYASTCGEIAGGWFMWALRDAAARAGHYESPREAAHFFRRIANEVREACASGALVCEPSLSSFMPVMTERQWRGLGAAIVETASRVAFYEPPPSEYMAPTPRTSTLQSRRYWNFLNFPRVAINDDEWSASGWYYEKDATSWPAFEVHDENGAEVESRLKRTTSPDLPWPNASMNRFTLTYQCPNHCAIATTQAGPSGTKINLNINEKRNLSATVGAASLYVDIVLHDDQAPATESIAVRIRKWLVHAFGVLTVLLAAPAIFVYAWALFKAVKFRRVSIELVVATCVWVLIGTRIVLLALIDISSFPAATYGYAIPATYLLPLAIFFSIGCAVASIRPTQKGSY
jgi:hypothetical protein